MTVLDTEGNMLSDPQTGNQNLQVSNAQLEVQQQIDELLGRETLYQVYYNA